MPITMQQDIVRRKGALLATGSDRQAKGSLTQTYNVKLVTDQGVIKTAEHSFYPRDFGQRQNARSQSSQFHLEMKKDTHQLLCETTRFESTSKGIAHATSDNLCIFDTNAVIVPAVRKALATRARKSSLWEGVSMTTPRMVWFDGRRPRRVTTVSEREAIPRIEIQGRRFRSYGDGSFEITGVPAAQDKNHWHRYNPVY